MSNAQTLVSLPGDNFALHKVYNDPQRK